MTNLGLESTLAMRYGDGLAIANVWEGDYGIPVKLKSEKADRPPDLPTFPCGR